MYMYVRVPVSSYSASKFTQKKYIYNIHECTVTINYAL